MMNSAQYLDKLRAKHGAEWRKHRRARFGANDSAGMGWNTWGNRRVPVFYGFSERSLPVRDVRFADEVAKLDHDGWFADAEGYGDRGTIRGVVARLSHDRFLSGYHWSDNGEFVLYCDEVYSDEDDAARGADSQAERYAEQCRDDDERFRAMVDAEGLCESKESDLRDAWEQYRAAWSAFLADYRHASAARKAREWVSELVSDLRAFRKEYEAAKQAYEGA